MKSNVNLSFLTSHACMPKLKIRQSPANTRRKMHSTHRVYPVGATRCNEDSANALKQCPNRESSVEHTNGNKTMLFLRGTNYCLCIAWQWILFANRGNENISQKLIFFFCKSLSKREIKKLLPNLFHLAQHLTTYCLAFP